MQAAERSSASALEVSGETKFSGAVRAVAGRRGWRVSAYHAAGSRVLVGSSLDDGG